MKTKLLLLAVSVAAFSSCSTMYKTGQTPDDVYYSPARLYGEAQEENTVKKDEVKNSQVTYYNTDDRLIRMGIMDSRWRYLNNDYDYSPYYHTFYNSQSYYTGFYTPTYNKFYYNDYYYNPYYCATPVYITSVKPIKNSTPRVTNLYGYGKNHNNTNAPLNYIPGVGPSVKYNKGNAASKLGKFIDAVLTPTPSFNQFNQTNTSDRAAPTTTTDRTYTPPPSSSTSSSSSSSSSGGKISRKD